MSKYKLLPVKPDNNMRSAASQLFARNPNANPVEYYCAMVAAAKEVVQPDHDAIRLVEALEVAKTVLESDDPAIADTIWVPDSVSKSETLYDHICSALAEFRTQGGDL